MSNGNFMLEWKLHLKNHTGFCIRYSVHMEIFLNRIPQWESVRYDQNGWYYSHNIGVKPSTSSKVTVLVVAPHSLEEVCEILGCFLPPASGWSHYDRSSKDLWNIIKLLPDDSTTSQKTVFTLTAMKTCNLTNTSSFFPNQIRKQPHQALHV
jgi:hypothetical protein